MEQIEKFQEKAYVEFQDYITKTYPDDTYRYLQVEYYLIHPKVFCESVISFFSIPRVIHCFGHPGPLKQLMLLKAVEPCYE